jgi:hypothetical protein
MRVVLLLLLLRPGDPAACQEPAARLGIGTPHHLDGRELVGLEEAEGEPPFGDLLNDVGTLSSPNSNK